MKKIDLTSLCEDEDQELIGKMVSVLGDLRSMNEERISFLLAQVRMAKPLFPSELAPGIESLEADFTLILAFIEQAKKYDRSEGAHKAGDWLLGSKKNEGAKTSGQ